MRHRRGRRGAGTESATRFAQVTSLSCRDQCEREVAFGGSDIRCIMKAAAAQYVRRA